MGRKNKELFIEDIEIQDVAAEGKAITRYENQVIFVPLVAPGDRVDLRVIKKRRKYLEGTATAFHHYSDKRIEPKCKHFGVCGGCKWQHLGYEHQLFYKQKQVADSFERIAKVEIPQLHPIIGSKEQWHYRNKTEFSFSNSRWLTNDEISQADTFDHRNALGFHVPGRFDLILDIEQCLLQDARGDQVRNAIRRFAFEQGYSFHDPREHTGFLRNFYLRNTSLDEWMIIMVFGEEDNSEIEKTLSFLKASFPFLTSIQYVINQKLNDTIHDLDVINYSGPDYIMEKLGDVMYKISPKSFFQTNSSQAHQLYQQVKQMADIKPNEIVYDLYTGTGSIALFVARQSKHVVGIEYVEAAIDDAWENARINAILNVGFYAGDMKDILTQAFIEENGKPDVIITDPPRAGMHANVVSTILKAAPERIVYVSCNPATQARDIALLDENYKVEALQPVDMFPHTHHVENIALLIRR